MTSPLWNAKDFARRDYRNMCSAWGKSDAEWAKLCSMLSYLTLRRFSSGIQSNLVYMAVDVLSCLG